VAFWRQQRLHDSFPQSEHRRDGPGTQRVRSSRLEVGDHVGIAGIVDFRGHPAPHRSVIPTMVARVHRRALDAHHVVIFLEHAWVGLGITRSSIIDLSDANRQSMTNENRSLWILGQRVSALPP